MLFYTLSLSPNKKVNHLSILFSQIFLSFTMVDHIRHYFDLTCIPMDFFQGGLISIKFCFCQVSSSAFIQFTLHLEYMIYLCLSEHINYVVHMLTYVFLSCSCAVETNKWMNTHFIQVHLASTILDLTTISISLL